MLVLYLLIFFNINIRFDYEAGKLSCRKESSTTAYTKLTVVNDASSKKL